MPYPSSLETEAGGPWIECQPGLHGRTLEQVQGMEKRKLRCIKILKMWQTGLAFHAAIVAWHSKSLSCHPQPCRDCHAPFQPQCSVLVPICIRYLPTLLQETYPSSKWEGRLNELCLKKAGRQYCWMYGNEGYSYAFNVYGICRKDRIRN